MEMERNISMREKKENKTNQQLIYFFNIFEGEKKSEMKNLK